MKKITFPIVTLGLLAACATPQEKCASNARSEHYMLQSQINKIQSNIARGYAVHKTREPFTVMSTCRSPRGEYFTCPRTNYRVVEKPVSIDMDEQRLRLNELEVKRADAYESLTTRIRQCRDIYPS